jgi:hypothetical protein
MWLWILLALASILVLVIYAPSSWFVRAIHADVAAITRYLGADTANRAILEANHLVAAPRKFAAGMVQSSKSAPLQGPLSSIYSGGSANLAPVLRRALLLLYDMLLRLVVVLYWLIPGAIAIGCAAADGATVRARKLLTFGYSSPITFNAASHSLIVLAFAPAVYLFIPFPFPPITPLLLACVFAIALHQAVANFQRT